MPLHDHPGMTVFTKVLIGSARLEAYDWARPRVLAGCCSGSRPRTLAKKVRDDHGVTAAASAWVLFPNSGGNMHRFAAAEDAHCAFLDVLTPPYAPTDRRRCTFYQDLPYEHHRPRPCTCRSTATGGAICDDDVLVAEEQTCRLAWLEEVPQPRNLRVVCLPFRGPTIF
jgi:plant cysteine oxidase